MRQYIKPAALVTLVISLCGAIYADTKQDIQENKEQVKVVQQKKLDAQHFDKLLEQQQKEQERQWKAIEQNQQVLIKMLQEKSIKESEKKYPEQADEKISEGTCRKGKTAGVSDI